MSDLGQNIREFVLKGIETIGATATNLAANTRQKISETALKAKKAELLEQFGEKAYEAYRNGMAFPEELACILREAAGIDAELASGTVDGPAEVAAEESAEEPEEPEEEISREPAEEPAGEPDPAPEAATRGEIPVIEMPEEDGKEETPKHEPLSSAISDLFGQMPPIDEMAGRINSSLDEMGEQLQKFSSEMGKKISDMADELMGKNDRED